MYLVAGKVRSVLVGCDTNVEISLGRPSWGMLDCGMLDYHLAAL